MAPSKNESHLAGRALRGGSVPALEIISQDFPVIESQGGGKRLPPENPRPPGVVAPLHVDMIFDNPTVWADDEVVVKDGEIVV